MKKLEKAEQWADKILKENLTEENKLEWKKRFLSSISREFNISDIYNSEYLELETYLNK